MKITSSAEYIEKFADISAEDISSIREMGLKEYADQLEIKKTRASVLKEIQQASGITLDVAHDLEPNVIAFATPDNDNGIAESALDDKEKALHGAHHEAEHQNNKIFNLPLEKLSPEDQEILQETFKITNIDETDLIEGFNEWSTFRKHDTYGNSGYAQKEVPLANKIEELVQKKLNVSILEIFRSGDKDQFVATLQRLAINLRLEKVLGNSLEIDPANDNSSIGAQKRAFAVAA